MSQVIAKLVLSPFDEAECYREFVEGLSPASGAVVSFTGRMRAGGTGGEELDRMVLEHHPERTEASLASIAATAAELFTVDAVRVVHRAGTILPGETIVWVAAAGPHRRAAFEAVDQMMDRLKTEAVLWKREEWTGGRRWVEPTTRDLDDRGRWEGQDAGTN